MSKSRSEVLFDRASAAIPGGVNSPVRAFRGVGGNPLFISAADGAWLIDADGRRYIDYVGSWGPMVLGHNNADVAAAIRTQLENGVSFGAPTELEVEMAELLLGLLPNLDLVRMVNSGTEATMSAIRLARGFTGRDLIIKFEGCYHGHADALLVKAGSGALTLGEPSSAGVPPTTAASTLALNYNDIEGLEQAFGEYGPKVAAVIVEPIAGNMNLILPRPGFLETLRELCSRHNAVLIFDEVMSGFRVGLQGAQGIYEVRPDLTTLGKIIGGGLPVGAFGGRREIMECVAPLGPVYQAGTLSGNPLAMAAGLATLRAIAQPGVLAQLFENTTLLLSGLHAVATKHGIPLVTNQAGGMFGLFFTDASEVCDFAGATACNSEQFRCFFHAMLKAGVYLAPSAFEVGFVSTAHDVDIIAQTVSAADQAFATLANSASNR